MRRRWLTRSGLIAAAIVGGAVTLGPGLRGLVLLVFFFVTSSALTRSGRSDRRRRESDLDAGGRRAGQVFANAGVAAAAALGSAFLADPRPALVAFCGALAAATADTWASEIGEWSARPTRLVTTWGRVDPGVDGGVSWPGSAAAVAASLAVGWLAAGLFGPAVTAGPVVAGGVGGMLADSVAGATIEGRSRWIRNDAVNWLGTLSGAAIALTLGSI